MTEQTTPAREPNRIVVQAAEQVRRSSKRPRRVHKDLHEPCTDQLTLFDPPHPEDLP
ncbi:hypothetical protein [Nocardia testacea]|uniref:hypothetical protein n=1 Tax=Nocardia testacea TaxID=248551 RepID=UPI003A852129